MILGLGGMLTWVTLLKYYENTRGYNLVLNTFENSSNVAFKALLGIMPVFIGFGVLGMCLFWKSKRFMSLGASMFSLFALMNGDMVFDTMHDLDTIDVIFAQLYLYSFVALSIMVIQNVFIVIIEDGYIISKFKSRNDWLKLAKDSQPIAVDDHYRAHLQGTELQSRIISPATGKKEPTQENPFAKLNHERKKDEKSRVALVRMLWHDKLNNNSINRMDSNNLDDSRDGTIFNNSFKGSMEKRNSFHRGYSLTHLNSPGIKNEASDSHVQQLENICKDMFLKYTTKAKIETNLSISKDKLKVEYIDSIQKMRQHLSNLESRILED